MRQICNPIPELGERNVFCPYYDRCLDHAVDQAWKTWHCSDCVHKVTRTQGPEVMGLGGDACVYYTIPIAVDRILQQSYV